MRVENFFRPANLVQALQFLHEAEPGEKTWVMAGGTDLMVAVNSRALQPKRVMDIWGIDELREITLDSSFLTLGALTTYTQMIEDSRIAQNAPLLRKAALEVGAVQIQNRGTLAGNIANGSPAGDTLPVLAVYEATVELASTSGRRWVPFLDFYTGYRASVLRPDELISRIRLPVHESGQIGYWHKVGTRRAQSISKVMVAALAETSGQKLTWIRLGIGSVAPTVVRARLTEAVLQGQPLNGELLAAVEDPLRRDISPIDDVRSTAEYRELVCANLVRRFLRDLVDGHE